jgi:protein-tyrosine-phosphatase
MIRILLCRCGVLCLLLGMLAWGQTTWAQTMKPANAAPAKSMQASPKVTKTAPEAASPSSTKAEPGQVAPAATVITIPGVCHHSAGTKVHAASTPTCETTISRAEFEKVIDAIQPDMPASARKQFAERYAMAIAMANKAHEMGLDHGPQFEEMMQLMRLQVLTQQLLKGVREKTAVTDKEVEDYYNKNASAYEEVTLERIFVPKAKETQPTATPADPKAHQENADSAADMKKEADTLHARAVAGEDFAKLQADAFEAAGMKMQAPNTKLTKIRRTAVPPDQSFVFDLKPGAVSDVSANQNGYLIYKMDAKESLPLSSVKQEIHTTLENQRMQDAMQSIRESTKPTYNDQYFAAAAPAMPAGAMAMPHRAAPAMGAPGAPHAGSTPAK